MYLRRIGGFAAVIFMWRAKWFILWMLDMVSNVSSPVRSGRLFDVRIDLNNPHPGWDGDIRCRLLVKYTAQRHVHFDEIFRYDVKCRDSLQ
jgi:hypothetical protein